MHTASKSSHSYDFRRHFDTIMRPGLVKYPKHLGYGVDEGEDEEDGDLDRTFYTDAKTYAWRLFKALQEAQEFCELGLPRRAILELPLGRATAPSRSQTND
jgi:hypothetical protein